MLRSSTGCNRLLLWLCLAGLTFSTPAPAKEQTLWLEELTSPEVKTLMAGGFHTILIPTGGTEQNGPALALGKHNAIVRTTAERIARAHGHTLIAPVIAYVPEGREGEGHMRYAGTISLRGETFRALLEDAASSFKSHGFTTIAFLGDSGENQPVQDGLAEDLSRRWAGENVRVLHLAAYYDMDANGEAAYLRTRGHRNPGAHAGIADAAELQAAAPVMVRDTGASGMTRAKLAELGNTLLNLKVQAALEELQAGRGR